MRSGPPDHETIKDFIAIGECAESSLLYLFLNSTFFWWSGGPVIEDESAITMTRNSSSRRGDKVPHPSSVSFTCPVWAPVTSRVLANAISVDLGCFATWRYRGGDLAPAELPQRWFNKLGRRNLYRVGAVYSWLHRCHGEEVSELAVAKAALAELFGSDLSDDDARALLRRLAENAGPRAWEVPFNSVGFQEYLDCFGAL